MVGQVLGAGLDESGLPEEDEVARDPDLLGDLCVVHALGNQLSDPSQLGQPSPHQSRPDQPVQLLLVSLAQQQTEPPNDLK